MSQASPTVDILFFGDLVGKAGRQAVYNYLNRLMNKPDIVIANVENTTHGFGLNQRHFLELRQHGIDIMTGGNHSFDRRELMEFIDDEPCLFRPCNLAGHNIPGSGAHVVEVKGFKLGVINLLGQAFMAHYNSPWEAIENELPALREEAPIIFLDFHAESTAEKYCMGHIAASMGVSAMVGTHTHVQTADERILMDRMGYISDVGFNGSRNSIIGMEPNSSISRMRLPTPVRLEVSQEPLVQVNAIRFTIEKQTGRCLGLTRIHEVFELDPALVA